MHMKVYTYSGFEKLLKRNGYFFDRYSGSHKVYVNAEGRHISVPLSVNPCITRRLIKENNLK